MKASLTILVLLPYLVSPQLFKGSQAINWSAGNPTSLDVKYGDQIVQNGTRLTTTVVAVPPSTIKWNADPAKFYLLAMIDPDAPAKAFPVFGEIVHWMVVNIQGGNMTSGKELASYIPPNPPLGSGPHRFVFMVYEQPYLQGLRGRLTFVEKFGQTVRSRLRFSMQEFANTYNLGDPVAQNYFTAGWLNKPITETITGN